MISPKAMISRCDDLFGNVPHGTIVAAAMPFEQWSVLERT